MKRALAVAVLSAVASIASAQMGGMKGMDMKDMDMKGMHEKKGPKGAVHRTTGLVTKVDADRGKVTIKHEPVKSLNWPSMTMAFTIKDKAMLEKMPKDKKVDFEFVQEGREYVVTSVK
jgi:Cu(I)/Ag(I) efflux system periplasmic protein CusF